MTLGSIGSRRFAMPSAMAALAVVLIAVMPLAATAADKTRLAICDLELNDTSLEGEVDGKRDDQTDRLKLASDELRRLVSEHPTLEIVDTAPQAAEIEKGRPLMRCNGCAARIGKALGADQVMLGEIYKVSNLIIDINIYVLDVKTGKAVQHASTSIRNNTDASWKRGVTYLAQKRLKFQ